MLTATLEFFTIHSVFLSPFRICHRFINIWLTLAYIKHFVYRSTHNFFLPFRSPTTNNVYFRQMNEQVHILCNECPYVKCTSVTAESLHDSIPLRYVWDSRLHRCHQYGNIAIQVVIFSFHIFLHFFPTWMINIVKMWRHGCASFSFIKNIFQWVKKPFIIYRRRLAYIFLFLHSPRRICSINHFLRELACFSVFFCVTEKKINK